MLTPLTSAWDLASVWSRKKPDTMSSPTQSPQEDPKNDWLDRLAQFNAHFGRFIRDVSGVVLLAIGAMTLMAVWGITRGALLTPWAAFLKLWLGWGVYLLVLAFVLCGIFLLRRDLQPIRFGWIITFEIVSFLSLGLLAALGGFDLARAELGRDGGLLGWGLATFLYHLGRSRLGRGYSDCSLVGIPVGGVQCLVFA